MKVQGALSLLAVLALAAGSVLATPILASAQDDGADGIREHRAGFWLSGGLGVGADEGWDTGGAGYLRLGGTLGERWALGFDAVALVEDAELGPDVEDETRTRTNGTAALYFFPSLEGGLFLKAGLGVSTVEASGEVDGVTLSVSDESLGATVGAGWDVQLGDGNLYLTPNLDVMLQDLENPVDAAFLATVGLGFR